jgi:FtsZ-interacting cell division protein YlmF
MAPKRRRFLESLLSTKPTNPKFLLQAIVLLMVFAAIINIGITTGYVHSDKHVSILQVLFFVTGALTSLFIYLTERSWKWKAASSSHLSADGLVDKNLNEALLGSIGVPEADSTYSGHGGIILFEPRSFDEMPRIVTSIDEGNSVIVNLTMMEPDQAQRAVDFVAGGTYGLGGHQERVGESIFLFTPANMEVRVSAEGLDQDSSSISSSNPKALAEGQEEKVVINKNSTTTENTSTEWGWGAPLSTISKDINGEGLGEIVITPTTASNASNPDIPKEDVSSDAGENLEDAAL